uniref:hypothetical protein n=1 Tax=Nocardia wallacei TaxID=480035 RepID=UPI0024589240
PNRARAIPLPAGAPRRRRALVLGLVSVTAIATASCADDQPESSSAQKPYPYTAPSALQEATSVWSAEPGLDLLSDQGLLARGAAESEFIANATKPDKAYWGFQWVPVKDDGRNVGKALNSNLQDANLVGTLHWRLMSLTSRKGGFDAEVCLQMRGASARFPVVHDPGKNNYVTWTVGSIQKTRIEFRSSKRTKAIPEPALRQTAPVAPDSQDALRWQGPSVDIFDGWQLSITNALNVVDSDPAETAQCRAWGYTLFPPPSAEDESKARMGASLGGGMHSVRMERPVTLPAYPGWPH